MSKKEKQRKEGGAVGFLSGVIALSLSTLAVKIIGLAFKIPMLSFLGTEGMGYFNSAYEIYALLCIISTAGLPVALSMMVSRARARGDFKEIKKVYRSALMLFISLGVVGSGGMLVFARALANMIGNPNAEHCIEAIAPALFFICIASAVRGYCQGFESMVPTAVSQLIEATAKLFLGVAFAVIAKDRGYEMPYVAAFAVLGITLGTVLSTIYLLISHRGRRYRCDDLLPVGTSYSKALTTLVRIALPITIGASVMGLTRIIDMTLIMQRLQDTGVSVAEANRVYGAYTTLAVPVFSLIPALITPVSLALVPHLSSSLERGDAEEQQGVVETAMRVTMVLALPAALGVAVFARPMLGLLFSGESEAIDISAPLLSILAISVPFSCLITTTNGILQANKRVSLPVISMAIGVAVKFATSYALIGDSRVGVMGAPIGSMLCSITVTVINLWAMGSHSGCILNAKKVFFMPLLSASVAVGISLISFRWLDRAVGGRASLLLALAVAAVAYAIISFLTGNITKDDIALLPFGKSVLSVNSNKKEKERKYDSKRKEEDAS